MVPHFNITRQLRTNWLQKIHLLSAQEMNFIPSGFNNNLAWNLGHILVTQQLLHYKLSNLPMYLEDGLVNKYRKGSRPESYISEAEISFLKDQSISLIARLELDYAEGLFSSYNTYSTSFGVELHNIEEATSFNIAHEALHYGVTTSMFRLL